MDWSDYLGVIRHEGDALAAAATDLSRDVPSCPGWTVADLLAHVGVVHRHKEQTVREGWIEDAPSAVDPPEHGLAGWYRTGLDSLVAVLSSVDPATPSWTWHEPDQTVGFWYRRMAHETLVHRIDAELAVGDVGPIDAALASDGFDELISVMLTGAPGWMTVEEGERTIEFVASDTGGRWLLVETALSGRFPATGTTYDDLRGYEFADASGYRHTTVSGAAADLLRFGWGRGPVSTLTVDGEAEAVARFRETAAEATR